MKTVTHTPTPWKQSGVVDSYGSSFTVAIYSDRADIGEKMPVEVHAASKSRAMANARLVVTACNAHDELVAACRAAMEAISGKKPYDQKTLADQLSAALEKVS